MRFAFSKSHLEKRIFNQDDALKNTYDVVIIGGGRHGLSAAYYLAKEHHITNVCVLEQSYIGSGNTG